jgi:sRNA-binding protein
MWKKKEIDPTYYDNNCLVDHFIEAEKNGTLIIIEEGESLEHGFKRLRKAQKRYEATKKKAEAEARKAARAANKAKTRPAPVAVA